MIRLVLVLICLAACAGLKRHHTAREGNQPMFKAIVHINFSDTDRQEHGLKNVANMLRDTEHAQIEVVCHGGGIELVVKDTSRHGEEVARLIEQGVRFAACENTMSDKSIAHDRLIDGVTTVPSGAVEVVRKQQVGFGYFKP